MSNRLEIVWTVEDGHRYLAFRDRDNEARAEPAPDATVEQIAELCDLDAEGANYHGFVGVHAALAAIVSRHAGREVATEILREVAERGGLHEMRGCFKTWPDSFDGGGDSRP